MVKVILETASRRLVDLFPEHISVREALNQLREDCDISAYATNGVRLDEEDLEKDLVHFSKEDEVRIITVSKSAPKFVDGPEDIPERAGFVTLGEMEAYAALGRIKEVVDQVMSGLGAHVEPIETDEVPF